jgi:hypothetical protein
MPALTTSSAKPTKAYKEKQTHFFLPNLPNRPTKLNGQLTTTTKPLIANKN